MLTFDLLRFPSYDVQYVCKYSSIAVMLLHQYSPHKFIQDEVSFSSIELFLWSKRTHNEKKVLYNKEAYVLK